MSHAGLQKFRDAFEAAQEKMATLLGKAAENPSEEGEQAAEALEKLTVSKEEKAEEPKSEEEKKE